MRNKNLILFFISILFSQAILFGAGVDYSNSLTLIPPSPVSDKITISIRGSVTNNENYDATIHGAFYLDEEKESSLLYKETMQVPAQSAKGINYRWQTKDQVGKHKIIFVAKSKNNTQRKIQPLEIRSSDVRSTRVIDGAWTGLYMWGIEGVLWMDELVKMNDVQWREYVMAMNEVGMNIIVPQESFRSPEFVGAHSFEEEGYTGKAFYPSELFPGRMPIESSDPLETILSEADKLGMYVFLPVGLYAWFDFTEGSLEWHKKVASELWQRYGHHPSFYGWYISEEVQGSLIPNITDKEIIKIRHEEIVNFFKKFQAHVRTLAPDKPVMFAPGCSHLQGGLDVYPKLLPYIDIISPFGYNRMSENDYSPKEAATILQELCDSAGTHLWMDLEAFLFGEYEELYPRPIEGLLHDLNSLPNFEKVLCFQFAGLFNAPWMSRKPGGDATVELYRDYKDYYEKKKKEFALAKLAANDDIPIYKNPAQPVEMRVSDLLKQMTLKEKIDLVSSDGFSTKSNIRLGIPEIIMTNGSLGPNGKGNATNYSACINMASTWDTSLINRVGQSIAEETRVLGYNMLLGPNINIARVPQGGRTFESFGEDPFLTANMAIAYIKGVQSKGVITSVKHFAVNNQEWNRTTVDVTVDERALHEIYFPAFKASVQEAGTMSIISAYNKVSGENCSSNNFLLNDILKSYWGFDGFVISDLGGVNNTIQTANSGLDLEMPNNKYFGETLLSALSNKQIELNVIDDKVKRILRAVFKSGLFDESAKDYGGYADTKERRALALEVAQKSIVLLKNDNQLLPLDETEIKSIAVIGPNANEARLFGGGSGYLNGHYAVSPLEGLRNKLGDNISIKFISGDKVTLKKLPPIESKFLIPLNAKSGEHGLLGEYFNNKELESDPVFKRIDKNISFIWEEKSPKPGVVNNDLFSVRWSGKFISPGDGIYQMGVRSDNGCRLYFDGELVIDSWTADFPSSLRSIHVELEKGKQYDIQLEFFENVGTCEVHLGLAYYGSGNALEQVVEIAETSDVAIVYAGLKGTMEGENNDRDTLSLPINQIKLIKAVANANKNTIVVLNNGTPIVMSEWIEEVPSVIEAFYPGQEGGNALADILFGDVNPSGKLPLTFIKKWEDSPAFGSYPGTIESANYSEGLYVGYRHFDKNDIEPLFPFGFGLSYTTFKYSELKFSSEEISPNDTLEISLTLTNTGKRAGDEIVQLYISDEKASVDREVKSLKGFLRVSLKVGEKKTISFRIDKNDLSFYDTVNKKWKSEEGKFTVLIGSSSRDIKLKKSFKLN